MGLAIFIEPHGGLKENILIWKAMVEAKFPDQPYCSHPPHSTLIHVNIQQEKMALEAISKMLKGFTAFKSKIVGNDVFWNDKAAGGGHTLYWKFKSNRILYDLQKQLAEALQPFIAVNPEPQFVNDNTLLKKSFDRYGSPFIGSHWIPHMTIASLQTRRDHPLIEEFLKQTGKYGMDVNEVSCWRVENDQHFCLIRQKLQ